MPEYKVSDYVVRYLSAQGVTHVFELCGGMLAHLLDSFAQLGGARVVTVHHEQGAGFAAEGFARMTGVPAVALGTSGPGATNLITPIGSCFFDNVPAVFITGQVNRNEMKGSRQIRQLGFQETDIVSLVRPITKDAIQVLDPREILAALDRAFATALGGRPGPVLLDLPMDVQRAVVSLPDPTTIARSTPDPGKVGTDILDLLHAGLSEAKRPLALVGGGVRSGRAGTSIPKALEQLGIPVVNSLQGVDVLGHDHPLRVGLIGSYGNRWANHALGECDFLLVIGSRLDIRQTGTDTEGFGRRRIFHVDIDSGEINNRVVGCVPVIAQIADFADAIAAGTPWSHSHSDWRAHLLAMRQRWPDVAELKDLSGLNPNVVMRELGIRSPDAAAFVVDVGQHQMWAAQSLPCASGQRFLTSGGMGAMGFALPASVGAAFAREGSPIVMIAGDGGFQLNIQELQTVVRNRLPIKMVVVNNRTLGMVRQFQESYFEGRYQSTIDGYDVPDFARIAVAYGIAGRTLDGAGLGAAEMGRALREALEWLWRDPTTPALLDVHIPVLANTYPKLAFGRPITEMEPQAKPLDMEGT